jgi:hypothetical protein
MFSNRSNVRLEARHFMPPGRQTGAGPGAGSKDRESVLDKPRRNPATGKIEDGHSTGAGLAESSTKD